MSASELLRRVERALVLGPANRPPRERSEIVTPGERAHVSPQRRIGAYAAGVLLPPAVAVALLPWRTAHEQVIALILVVPVIGVAVLGAVGPALVAALSAGIAYDVVHTQPHWHVKIDNSDDIATTVALVFVALVVGALCSRVVQLAARASARGAELRHLLLFARFAASDEDVDDLAAEVCRQLTGLLHLRNCSWHAGYHGTAGPVLLPSGAVMGHLTSLNPDRAKLPAHLEVPAVAGADEIGRFVLEPDGHSLVSAEERLTAAVIVALFARTAIGNGKQHSRAEEPS
jgi:K+-sensing histidine kinase KdpD